MGLAQNTLIVDADHLRQAVAWCEPIDEAAQAPALVRTLRLYGGRLVRGIGHDNQELNA